MAGRSKPVVGVIGQINQRIDVATMTALATRHPDWTLVFIGPLVRERVDVSMLESLPNVRFLGLKPAADLPRYLKSIDVCLIPYIVDDHTRYMHPLKTLEYLAAGRPVVSTPLPALSIYEEHVALAGDTGTFIAAVERALTEDSPAKRAARAASCTAASVHPASTEIVLFCASTATTRLRQLRLSTTARPDSSGVAAPHRLVLPPCGTMGTPAAAQVRTTAATSAVQPGRATQSAAPR